LSSFVYVLNIGNARSSNAFAGIVCTINSVKVFSCC